MAKLWWQKLGPGLITGASDDDPSGIITYTQAGARFGYGLLWLAVVTTPLMMAVQEMSARLAIVSGTGLNALLKRHISRRLAIGVSLLVFAVNTFNIGADLGAMAEVMKLVLPGSTTMYLLLFTALMIGLEIWLPYHRYVRVLKWLTVVLLAYVATMVVVTKDWLTVATSVFQPRPGGGSELWLMIVAVLGTTISPYLFFWQASEEVEEQLDGIAHQQAVLPLPQQFQQMRRDTWVGMIFSNLIMFCIIVTAAVTLHAHGIYHIATARQAAVTLQPIAGQLAFLLFTLGIIGTGLLAIPVLAGSAAYAVAEAFDWTEGLSKKFRQAKRFYLVIIGATVAALLTQVFGVSPIRLLFLAAVLNGLAAPFVLWFIITLADRPAVVGEHRSPRAVRLAGWLIFVFMTVAALVVVWQTGGGH